MRTLVLASVLFCFTVLLSACPDGVEAVPTPEGMVTVIKTRAPHEKNPLPRQ